jgi:hypothetical protein
MECCDATSPADDRMRPLHQRHSRPDEVLSVHDNRGSSTLIFSSQPLLIVTSVFAESGDPRERVVQPVPNVVLR